MPDAVVLLPALAAGIAGGVFFFAGLWWTVGRAVAARHPVLFLAKSFALRTAVLLATLYLSAGDDIILLGCYFAGFLAARGVLVKMLRPAAGS